MSISRISVLDDNDDRAVDLDRVTIDPEADSSGPAPLFTFIGGAGNDTFIGDLFGFPEADTMFGNDGNDTLEGRGADDVMFGGNGNDTIRYTGGLFEDADAGETLDGGAGTDRVLAVGGTSNVFDWRDADFVSIEEIEFNFDGDLKFIYLGSQELDTAGEIASNVLIDGDASARDVLRLWVNQGQNTIDASAFRFQNWTDGTDEISYQGDAAANTFIGSIQRDFMYGGAGNDSMDGGAGTDFLYGGVDIDTLSGGAGADSLYGGGGNDVLEGGSGLDLIFGGDGNDRLVYNAGFGYGETADGDAGVDTIDFSNLGLFVGFDITIDLVNGYSDTAGSFTITEVENVEGSVSDETIIGNGADNTLSGNGGNDSIDGWFGGEDVLFGGDGNDTFNGRNFVDDIFGGAGDDTVSITGGDFIDNVYGGSGDDTIDLSAYNFGISIDGAVFTGPSQVTTIASIEEVIGSDFADFIRIDSFRDTIRGGGGNDTLQGGFNSDSIFGGDGDDLIQVLDGEFFDDVYGGAGIDTLDHSTVTRSGDTFDFETGTLTSAFSSDGTHDLSSIEVYRDGSGGNTIISSGTSATYFGNGGNDLMVSEIGGETMYGGGGNDTIDHTRFSGNYLFNMATGLTNFGAELYTGFETAIMGSGDDTVTGTTGTDSIFGGAGDDLVNAGDTSFGNGDVYDGGGGNGDTMSYAAFNWGTPASPVEFRLAAGTAFFAGFVETMANFENFLGSQGDELIVGTTGDNTLQGNGGNDTIRALKGNDIVNGDAGDDFAAGGAGDDIVNGGAGNDLLRGKIGNDTVDGGIGNDTVNGGLGDDILFGGDGDDLMFGKGQIDIMYGGADNDILNGARDNDVLYGGSGDDILRGQANDDRLVDGDGADTLNGGNGQDIFDLGVDGDTDVIFDYTDGRDTIRLAGETFLGLSITTQVPGRVQILYNGGTEELIVRDGGAGLLTAADLDPGDFLFV